MLWASIPSISVALERSIIWGTFKTWLGHLTPFLDKKNSIGCSYINSSPVTSIFDVNYDQGFSPYLFCYAQKESLWPLVAYKKNSVVKFNFEETLEGGRGGKPVDKRWSGKKDGRNKQSQPLLTLKKLEDCAKGLVSINLVVLEWNL